MKKIISIGAGLLVAGLIMAGDSVEMVMINESAVPSTTTTIPLMGFLDSIYVNITGTTTGTLSITTASGELVYSNVTAISADTTVRPRVQANATDGTVLGYATNAYERILLVNEKLSLYLSEAAGATNNYYIRIRLSDK